VVLAGTALAAVGLAAALLLGGWVPALVGFACVGLGMAAVTPCLYVAAAKQGSNALALVASAGTGGLLVGPPIIGLVAGASSLVWGMTVVVTAIVLVFLSTTQLSFGAPSAEAKAEAEAEAGAEDAEAAGTASAIA
jgi:MFS family permease